MPTIRRLTDSCLLVTTDAGTSLIDPGFHTFDTGEVDLDSIGDVQRVLITHEHADHVKPEFVRWAIDRGTDVTVYANDAVAAILAEHDIETHTTVPDDCTVQDVLHEPVPTGATPPNRAWSVSDVLTHPGDSHQPTSTGAVLALPLIVPWGSATAAVEFARRLGPRQVIPVHDFYLTRAGADWIAGFVGSVLAGDGIELVPLGWGDSYSL